MQPKDTESLIDEYENLSRIPKFAPEFLRQRREIACELYQRGVKIDSNAFKLDTINLSPRNEKPMKKPKSKIEKPNKEPESRSENLETDGRATKQINARIPADLWRDFKMKTVQEGKKITTALVELLQKYVGR